MHEPPCCVVVDDDPAFLGFALDAITRLSPGTKVIGFDSSMEAIAHLRTHPVDLIVTDFRMPFVNGANLVAAVRLAHAKVPIVLMSGENVEEEALAAGANSFVLKPSLPKRLRDILGRAGLAVVPPEAGVQAGARVSAPGTTGAAAGAVATRRE